MLCEARGKWERTYVYEPDSFVPLARLDNVAEDGDNGRHSEVHHIHTDQLGTPNEITDQQGEIVWASEYKAWDNVLRVVQAAPKRHSVVAVEVEAANDVAQFQPIRFLGQYHDTETGLNYNRFRYYDGDCGRYVSLDPIGLAGGSNSYQYAPNPSGWIDPLGLSKTCPCNGANSVGANSSSAGPAFKTISEMNFPSGVVKFTDSFSGAQYAKFVKDVEVNGMQNKVITYVEIEGGGLTILLSAIIGIGMRRHMER